MAEAFHIPPLTGPVVDLTGTLDAQTTSKLSTLLQNPEILQKVQLQVLVVPSLEGEPIESASLKVVDTWKLGSEKADNGILFIVALNDRKMRIEVGQGLEGDLPDVLAKRIISDVVAPLFRQGLISEGISTGTLDILRVVAPDQMSGERPLVTQHKRKGASPSWILLIFLLIIIIKILGFFTSPMSSSRYGRGGRWGGGGFGGGGFGGGGGGWSGGGGGFSGGGSSGSW